MALDGTNQDSHIAASSAVHGITGSVVGTTDQQTLTNKTIPVLSGTQTVVAGNLSVLGTIFGNVSASAVDHNTLANLQGSGVGGEYFHFNSADYTNRVTTTGSVTLSNKTIPVISGTTTTIIGAVNAQSTINAAGDITIASSSSGVILKDTNGVNWRITVNTNGTLSTTSL